MLLNNTAPVGIYSDLLKHQLLRKSQCYLHSQYRYTCIMMQQLHSRENNAESVLGEMDWIG